MARQFISRATAVSGMMFGGMVLGSSVVTAQGTSQPAAQPPVQVRKVDVTVTILEVRAIDVKTQADLFARVTIAGDMSRTRVTPPKPSLRVTLPVPENMLVPVRIELFDKTQLTFADQVDINQVPGKRDLDFVVDPAKCTISGFSQSYKCTELITRTGQDAKPAEIVFRIDVVR